ncbi:MAG: hypothetical protein ACHQNE_03200, partial [Candidatus Kapaibacterium sp.]
ARLIERVFGRIKKRRLRMVLFVQKLVVDDGSSMMIAHPLKNTRVKLDGHPEMRVMKAKGSPPLRDTDSLQNTSKGFGSFSDEFVI